MLVAYVLFDAGYIAYATFIVALLRTGGLPNGTIAMVWIVPGLAAVVSAFAWGPVLGHLSGGWGATTIIVVVTMGSVTPLLCTGVNGTHVSAMLFGSSASVSVVGLWLSFVILRSPPRLSCFNQNLTKTD